MKPQLNKSKLLSVLALLATPLVAAAHADGMPERYLESPIGDQKTPRL